MKQSTKESPGCYHDMIHHLSQLDGLSYLVADVIYHIRDLYRRPDARKSKHKGLKYKSYDIRVIDTQGNWHPFVDKHGQRFDKWANPINPDYFLCDRLRRLDEFYTKPMYLNKSYNDSLPGGWYQKVEMWQIGDKFFANMECTC